MLGLVCGTLLLATRSRREQNSELGLCYDLLLILRDVTVTWTGIDLRCRVPNEILDYFWKYTGSGQASEVLQSFSLTTDGGCLNLWGADLNLLTAVQCLSRRGLNFARIK